MVAKVRGPGMADARHSILTPVKLPPNYKTSEAGKRHYIFATVFNPFLFKNSSSITTSELNPPYSSAQGEINEGRHYINTGTKGGVLRTFAQVLQQQ
ncbi:hypothetical protein AVEN_174242-1 [Araneus ventricosus]|uniref:Uncharacterized protein n=1 Tax=Araneus ventricosus TaxID=182803 RepID=A0A4Y2LEM9_ARAVE|nr:hypothetical protein AVEN_174242-1 [Araneus ventricosus]